MAKVQKPLTAPSNYERPQFLQEKIGSASERLDSPIAMSPAPLNNIEIMFVNELPEVPTVYSR